MAIARGSAPFRGRDEARPSRWPDRRPLAATRRSTPSMPLKASAPGDHRIAAGSENAISARARLAAKGSEEKPMTAAAIACRPRCPRRRASSAPARRAWLTRADQEAHASIFRGVLKSTAKPKARRRPERVAATIVQSGLDHRACTPTTAWPRACRARWRERARARSTPRETAITE